MATDQLDIGKNRSSWKYSRQELFYRILWGIIRPLFLFSPRNLFCWRRFLLRLFGAKIGKEVHIYNSATIYMPWNLEIGDWSSIGEDAFLYNLAMITIGSRTTISHRAHLCAGTHDYEDSTFPLLKKPITIKDDSWICTDAFVGPGVTVGAGAVVGARSVVVKDVAPWTVVAGNPAIFINRRNLRK